jgi:hypothetical protein
MNRRIWLLATTALLAALVIIGMANAALASLPAGVPSAGADQSKGATAGKQQTQYSDDFDSLKPAGLKGLSYSTLVNSGKVHVTDRSVAPPTALSNLFAPLLNIVWGTDHLTGSNAGEPGVGINQTLPIYALVSGNTSIDHTSDGGLTWTSLASPPNPHGYGDVVNGWLSDNPNHALEIALNPTADGADMTCAQSTDFGATWTTFTACSSTTSGVTTSGYFDDREYIWVDNSPSSPFHGRIYVTEALFDPAGSGSYNTVTIKWSSDQGITWHPPSNQPLDGTSS